MLKEWRADRDGNQQVDLFLSTKRFTAGSLSAMLLLVSRCSFSLFSHPCRDLFSPHFIRYRSVGTSVHFTARNYFFEETNLRRRTRRNRFSAGMEISYCLYAEVCYRAKSVMSTRAMSINKRTLEKSPR